MSNVIDIILPVDNGDVSEEGGEIVSWSDGADGGNMVVESFVAFSNEGADVEEDIFTLDCPLQEAYDIYTIPPGRLWA